MAILVLRDDLAEGNEEMGKGGRVALPHGLVKLYRGAVDVHGRGESMFLRV